MTYHAIITSDWHVSDQTPRIRKDQYLPALAKKARVIKQLQRDHDGIPIIDGGDMLNKWNNSPHLTQWILANLPRPFYTCIGNHDLPNHNLSEFHRGTMSLLEMIETGIYPRGEHSFDNFELFALPYGEEHTREVPEGCCNVLLSHRMVVKEDPHHNLFDYITGYDLLKEHPEYDLIVTGHNHDAFTCTVNEGGRVRRLINPGSLMVREIGQLNHVPAVYLWDADNNTLETVEIPCEDCIDMTRVERHQAAKLHEAEMGAFVKGITDMKDVSLDFLQVLDKVVKDSDVTDKQEKLIWRMADVG